MNWTEEQKSNILVHYNSIEEYEEKMKKKEAEKYLEDTDYTVIKAYEYMLSGKKLENDYTEVFKKREEMREILRK